MSAHAKDSAPSLRYHNPALHPMDKPPGISLVELGTVVVAYLFALIAPAFVVSPSSHSAPTSRVVLATGMTVVGALVAVVVSYLAYRRTRNFSWLVIGSIPAITLIILAAIMAGTKAG
jgi:branched-subunit amino acid transport protein